MAAALALLAALAGAAAERRRNWFDDPFAQATHGLAACPVPEGPLTTEAEMRREAHHRAERGTTCWLAGRCPEPNAYARDAQVNAAAVQAIAAEPRLRASSVWVITQRRFVFLQGCVRDAAQRRAVVAAVRRLPGVDAVVDELMVGTSGRPPYRVAASASAAGGPGRN